MGIFGLFGNKKNETESEEAREAALREQQEQKIKEVKKAYEGMEWPAVPRHNNVVIGNAGQDSEEKPEDTLTEDRKNEVGELIYDPNLSPNAFTELSGQELLFLLTAMEAFNKKAPLPGFESNSRKVYYELLGRIRDAKVLYVLYDMSTGYPFIENGYGHVYFEKELAERMAAVYEKQFHKLSALERKVVDDENPSNKKAGLFEYFYYLGIENLVIDNGGYRARFKRNEIVAAPGDWNMDEKDKAPSNPALNFAMTDLIQEAKWPVNYDKKKDVLKAKEMRMMTLIRNGSFIVPMQHEGPAQVMSDGRIQLDKDTKTKFLLIRTPDGKQFVPVCTDGFEFARINKDREWNAAIFKFRDLVRLVNDKDGIRINPAGQGIVVPKQQMMLIEVAGQQADALKGKKVKKGTAGLSDDEAVTKALGQALEKMKDENRQDAD
jgi:hypothetical protein